VTLNLPLAVIAAGLLAREEGDLDLDYRRDHRRKWNRPASARTRFLQTTDSGFRNINSTASMT